MFSKSLNHFLLKYTCGYVWMWELDCEESWAPKNWCFWIVVLEKSLESPLKEISPGISLEGMMLKLKLQYFGHLMRSVDSLEKTLMLWGIGGRRRRGLQRMRWLNGHEFEWTPDVGVWQGGLASCHSWGCKVGHDWVTELNWTELLYNIVLFLPYINMNPTWVLLLLHSSLC